MKLRKTVIVVLILGLVASILLTGCGSEPANNDSQDKQPSNDEQITLKFLHRWGEEGRIEYFQDIVEGFEAMHPNVKIDMETLGNEAMKDKLRIMVGGNTPDIFFSWSGEFQRKFARAGASLDLTSYLEEDSAWKDSFMDSIWDSCSLDGRIYGIPFDFNAEVFTYNKAIFKETGVEVPKTWSEFVDNCEKIKKEGYTPLLLGNRDPWNGIHWLTNFNVRFVDPDVKKADAVLSTAEFTDPGYKLALDELIMLNEKGYFNEGINSTGYLEQFELFIQGKGAMMSDGTQVIGSRYPKALDNEEWDYFIMPPVEGADGNQNTIAGAPDLFLVSADTEHPDLCIEFMKYLTSMENAKKLANDVGFTPCIKGALDESNSIPQVRRALEDINKMDSLAEWIDTDLDARIADVYLAAGQEIFNGRTSNDVMKEIQKVVDEIK